jgi:peptide/nickel transport system ATP-binding protein
VHPLLEINNLNIDFQAHGRTRRVVEGLSLHLNKGETLGIVGESGSGKSLTALSVMRLLPESASPGGHVFFNAVEGQAPVDLLSLPETAMPAYRGARISMIFQEPMTSLNPVMRCGQQVAETLQHHRNIGAEKARAETLRMFERVNLTAPEIVFDAYPHHLSGGQKQRVMIAMAMCCRPDILIADEPTTALDVRVQKGIIDLMRSLREEEGLAMLFISHDLGVIAEICDRVVVMHAGRIVEEGPVDQIMSAPAHPYTRGLVASRPSIHRKLYRMPTVQDFVSGSGFETRTVAREDLLARRKSLLEQAAVLQIDRLSVRYPIQKNWFGRPYAWVNAVNDVSFDVYPGETFGLAGESGCGKTTIGRAVTRLADISNGRIRYRNAAGELLNLPDLSTEDFRPCRRDLQMIFQDPYASLNPRMRIGDAIVEPMDVHRIHETSRMRREKAVELLETVGLEADHFRRYPHEFSGGQRQRICIARALALTPRILICDEIVSSLDVSVQATVLNLLMELQEKLGLTYIFISHDLGVMRQMCDRIMIMRRGEMADIGSPEYIFEESKDPYVRELVAAVPGQ